MFFGAQNPMFDGANITTGLQPTGLGEKKLQQIKNRNKTLNCSADSVGYDSDMLSLSLIVAQTSLLGTVESSWREEPEEEASYLTS